MHILFVLEHFKPYVGWAEILFDNVVKWLVKEWNRVTVLTSRFDKTLPKYEKRDDGVEIYRVGHNRYDFMIYALGEKPRKLAKTADIIHTTTYNAAIPAKILSMVSHKKIVITIHEIFEKNWTVFMGPIWIFYRWVESCILHIPFHKIICVSNATNKSLIKRWISEKKTVTIYNWIDYWIRNTDSIHTTTRNTIRETHKLTNSFVWFFFGRPGISKWVEYFIRAIPEIVHQIPHFIAYLLVSKNDIKRYEYVRDLAHSLWVEKYIIWWESVPYKELINYINMADFTIIPSLAEWFGFAAVEAATVWNPVIVTTAWSLPEVISWKVAFVKPRDAADIASKVFEVYQWTYETIPQKTFSRDENIAKTLSVYHELLWK